MTFLSQGMRSTVMLQPLPLPEPYPYSLYILYVVIFCSFALSTYFHQLSLNKKWILLYVNPISQSVRWVFILPLVLVESLGGALAKTSGWRI